VAALAVAMAAGLVGMASRKSQGSWEGAAGAAAQADALRRRAAPLAQLDAEAYERALAAMKAPPGRKPEHRDAAIARALDRAAEVPLQIAEAAADASALAATVAELGDQAVRGDAAAAASISAGAAQAAANLVAVNLAATEDEPRVQRARRLADAAAASARRVLDLPPS